MKELDKGTHRRKSGGQHAPSLWSMWTTAPLAVLFAGGLCVLIFWGLHRLAGDSKPPTSNLDLIKTTLTVAALIAAVLTGVYAYRKQRVAEGDASRADAQHLADLYAKAAEQLGHANAAVRLAGVYAMTQLADDWKSRRQACIDVLCAYVRMPYDPSPESPIYKEGERTVRSTVLRVIREHLKNPSHCDTWCGSDLDFTGAYFDEGSFSECNFIKCEVLFDYCTFTGGATYFYDAKFRDAEIHFFNAKFKDATIHFDDSSFSSVHLYLVDNNADSSRFNFEDCSFEGCVLDLCKSKYLRADINFTAATFDHETSISFKGSTFELGSIEFTRAAQDDCRFDLHESQTKSTSVDLGPFVETQGPNLSI
ncbi:pentapeptide repeat-containing protein [Amycolatopsis sp. cmx-11-12]|uniref:pentapeptide repeat-containing protein n=1 Tax=Amycolatopsis sp. cmx-11-12 TaxID=2785795 RepID=UPI003917E7AE